MQANAQRQETSVLITIDQTLNDARTVLLIDAPSSLQHLTPQPGRQAVVLTQKRMLSAEMIQEVNPDIIIGPLITPEWDIVDLGVQLEALGYRGNLFALTRPLPRAELVIREVSAVCPTLNVRLLEVA